MTSASLTQRGHEPPAPDTPRSHHVLAAVPGAIAPATAAGIRVGRHRALGGRRRPARVRTPPPFLTAGQVHAPRRIVLA